MASDAATRWVAPFFMSVPNQYPGSVTVLNLGPGMANVTVTFFTEFGDKESATAKPIEGSKTALFGPKGLVLGWVWVESDQPIFPSGQTFAAGTYYASEIIPLTFYRAEGIDIEEWVRVRARDARLIAEHTQRSGPGANGG